MALRQIGLRQEPVNIIPSRRLPPHHRCRVFSPELICMSVSGGAFSGGTGDVLSISRVLVGIGSKT